MTAERRESQPSEGHVPVAGGLHQPSEQPPEAAHPPPEPSSAPQAIEVAVFDLATVDAERIERCRQQQREASRRWRERHPEAYHTAQRRWREKDPEQTREAARRNSRAYRQRKKQQLTPEGEERKLTE